MKVIVSGRHMSVSEDVKNYCIEKAEKLTRYYDRLRSIEVILDGHSGSHSVEMIVHADRTDPFIASQDQDDIFAAVDLVVDKLERQLTRHKERHRNRKHMARPSEEDAQ